jgi:hypothetical protein
MSKANDVDDLLGTDTKPATKKPAAKKTVAAAAPAKAEAKPAAKKTAVKEEVAAPAAKKAAKPAAEAKAPRVKEPVVFEEGEKEALMKRVKQTVKKPWNSKELATKLEVPTRKLRQVLYAMSRAGTVDLALASSRALGMTVSPATAA